MIRLLLAFIIVVLAACDGAPPSATSGDAGNDLPATDDTPSSDAMDVSIPGDALAIDTALDAPAEDRVAPPDVPTIDTAGDVTAPLDTSDAEARCSRDEDCTGRESTPVCDAASGRCVLCTPASDRCPAGQYCVTGMNRCAPGCRDDASCGVGADGGVMRRCDTTTRGCVDCVRDEHCAAGALCVGNICVPGCSMSRPCPAGQSCCSGACMDTQTNIMSCGACDRRCSVPNAVPRCVSGACGAERCIAPYGDCDGMAANGCETDTATEAAHCGACGRACAPHANSTATCEMGTCRYVCQTGFGDCDGMGENGCETDLRVTPAHCGACGRACMLPNASPGCALGACTVASCTAGFANCNGNATDGCEIDVRTSLSHCGGCGRACAPANATPACSAGTCAIASCSTGFDNCDGTLSNGCETDLRVTTAHCGACGRACPAPTGPHTVVRCGVSGGSPSCGLACETGWLDCDTNLTNGCEAMGSCTRSETLFTETFEAALSRWSLSQPWRQWDGFFGGRIPYRGRSSLFAVGYPDPCRLEGYATMTADIDVSRAVSLTLQFASYSRLGRAEGYGLEVSNDRGGSWTDISSFFLFTTDDWETRTVDLSAFAGRPTLRFRFRFLSLCPGPYFEWDIDELSVQALVRNY